MLGSACRQQEADQRENDVDSEIDERLVGPGCAGRARVATTNTGGRQSEHRPPQLHPPLGAERSGQRARHRQAVHHIDLSIRAIDRA